jgi:hypothetical protein
VRREGTPVPVARGVSLDERIDAMLGGRAKEREAEQQRLEQLIASARQQSSGTDIGQRVISGILAAISQLGGPQSQALRLSSPVGTDSQRPLSSATARSDPTAPPRPTTHSRSTAPTSTVIDRPITPTRRLHSRRT